MTTWGYIALGLFGGVASALLFGMDLAVPGAVVAVAAVVVGLIGVIAEGVRIGNRESD